MRARPDQPRPRPARRRIPRGRILLIGVAVALFVLLTSLRGIAGFWTDYLWFAALDHGGVWATILGAKVVLAVLFTLVFFVLMWGNLVLADRLAPRFRPPGPEEEIIERYHELIGSRMGLVRLGVSALFALVAGAGVSGQWEQWLLFTNRVDFGVADPQFNTDIGFYVFQLPFLSFVLGWLFASLVVVLIVTAVAHYLNGGIRIQTAGERVTPQVKAHLSVLLAVLALMRAGSYWLDRYELNFSSRGVVDGASYTDVNAQLPALHLLLLISLAATLLFIINIWRRGWVLPLLAVGIWAFVAVVVAGIYPAFVQRFRVQPAESRLEEPYIDRNIAATRAALALDDVDVSNFAASTELSAENLQENQDIIRNVRLLDPNVVDDTYQRLQGIRGFYRFPDLDVDRYELDGEVTQVILAARELRRTEIPQQSWEGRTLAYTHGYGLAAAPANATTPTGRPNFVLGGLPPSGSRELALEQPAIYHGEATGGYAIVNSGRSEIDYVAEDGSNVTTTYAGEGGVSVGGVVRRVAFALRFGDLEPVISGFVEDESRVMYVREVRDRVQMLAPFLHFDADPYPVIQDGRIVYVIDGYTTSDRYPYAQSADTGELTPGSDLDHGFNYIRNSVKAVVDSYNGTVEFYVMDPEDPIVNAWRNAFPDLFTDLEEMPVDLREHLRYPEDLFRTQTTMWGRYHIDQADAFYEQTDEWDVAQDPGTEVEGATAPTTRDPQTGQITRGREPRMTPFYLLMRLPGEDDMDFVLLRPFVPFSEDDTRNELQAFMVAKSDPDDYGELQTFVMPRDDLPDGPKIIASNIATEEAIARRISLLDQRGSNVIFGNLVVVPIEQSLLWVRPLYVQAAGGGSAAVPELQNVIVIFGDQVVMTATLRDGLEAIFGVAPETREAEPTDGEDGDAVVPDGAEPTADVAELLSQAEQAFAEAEQALRDGDLATYQQRVQEAQQLVQQAREASSPTTTTTAPPEEAEGEGGTA